MDLLHRLFMKLEARDGLTPAERAALAEAAGPVETYDAGEEIVREGDPQGASRLLAAGVCARSKTLDDGRRQIIEIQIPGDFVDLHSLLLKRLDHDIVAVTPVRIVNFPHERLRRITEQHPHLTRMLWLNTLLDGAIHREWIVSAGRRTAAEQIANLFCEMLVRYRVVGLAEEGRCPLPLTQQQVADACGLTSVHVNRTVQEMRQAELVEWRGGELVIRDFERLAALGRFDPAYMYLTREPR